MKEKMIPPMDEQLQVIRTACDNKDVLALGNFLDSQIFDPETEVGEKLKTLEMQVAYYDLFEAEKVAIDALLAAAETINMNQQSLELHRVFVRKQIDSFTTLYEELATSKVENDTVSTDVLREELHNPDMALIIFKALVSEHSPTMAQLAELIDATGTAIIDVLQEVDLELDNELSVLTVDGAATLARSFLVGSYRAASEELFYALADLIPQDKETGNEA